MAAGKREESRKSHLDLAWAIGQLFQERKSSQAQIEAFIQIGDHGGSNVKEPRNPKVDDLVAKTLKNGGRLVFPDGW